jgi:predicted MFS family arabinose efflux permease
MFFILYRLINVMKKNIKNRHLYALGFIATSSFSIYLVLPLALGGMVEHLGFSDQQIGYLALISSIGLALGSLWVPLRRNEWSFYTLARWSLLALLLLDLGSIWATDFYSLSALRFVAGFFGGVIYAATLSALSALPMPERGFTYYVLVYCSISALYMFLTPFLLKIGQVPAVFGFMALNAGAGFLLTPSIREVGAQNASLPKIQLGFLLKNKLIWFTLSAYLFLQMGCGAIWAYLERIGNFHGFGEYFLGITFGVSEFAGVLASILVLKIGNSKGVLIPIITGILLLSVSTLASNFLPHAAVFLLAVFVLSGAWAGTFPYFQKVQAMHDPHGKIVSLGAVVNLFGKGMGPATAAFFLTADNYNNVVWTSLIAFMLSFILIFPELKTTEKKL